MPIPDQEAKRMLSASQTPHELAVAMVRRGASTISVIQWQANKDGKGAIISFFLNGKPATITIECENTSH